MRAATGSASYVLDGAPAVCLIGVQKAAGRAECRFASGQPEGKSAIRGSCSRRTFGRARNSCVVTSIKTPRTLGCANAKSRQISFSARRRFSWRRARVGDCTWQKVD
jgi:hypothetical protein